MHVLTPSGGRPEGLALLGRYLNAQTYTGPIHWIVCDDVDPASPIPPVRDGITVEVIRPEWRWTPNGGSTQARSMLALLDAVPAGASVVVAEDDDVYLPNHLQTMVDAMQSAELVGQRGSYYYNVQTRRHRTLPGKYHASLGATALRGSAIGALRTICTKHRDRLDMHLWAGFGGSKKLLDTRTSVGIKGLPGRGGIGVGHRPDFGTLDEHGDVLREWIGDYAPEYRWYRRK